MKRVVAAFIAGVVLATAASAVAFGGYWKQQGTYYKCSGNPVGVYCKDMRYRPAFSAYIFNKSGTVTLFEGDEPIFSCHVRFGAESCTDFR